MNRLLLNLRLLNCNTADSCATSIGIPSLRIPESYRGYDLDFGNDEAGMLRAGDGEFEEEGDHTDAVL